MLSAIVFGMIAAGVALTALVLVQRAADFTRRNGALAAAFAGGLVITISVIHLIPEALAMVASAPWLILLGFGFGFVVHNLLGAGAHDHGHGHGHDHEPAQPRLSIGALAPVFAIALHSALDGVIYSVTFAVDSNTAIIAAVGLIIHEFPEALICFVLLQRAGLSTTKATIFAFLASGATTFGAAAISAPYANLLDAQTLGMLFAVVAGLLLHVGAAHLLHEAGNAGPLRGGVAVFAGVGVAIAMSLGHSHGHGGGHAHGHDHTHGHGHAQDDHDHAPIAGDAEPDDDLHTTTRTRPGSLRASNPDLPQGDDDAPHGHDHEDGPDPDHDHD